MSELLLYPQRATLKKLSPDSADADKEGYVILASGIKIQLQPLGPEYTALMPEGESGKMYRGITTHRGIKIGMIIETEGTATIPGMQLKVIGVEEWNGPLGYIANLSLLKAAD
jgi:hypothetical protein